MLKKTYNINKFKIIFKGRLNNKNCIFSFFDSHLIPTNIGYALSFNLLAGLVIEVISGIVFATHHIPNIRCILFELFGEIIISLHIGLFGYKTSTIKYYCSGANLAYILLNLSNDF